MILKLQYLNLVVNNVIIVEYLYDLCNKMMF